ncbi:MAG: PH domain-containing protein [Polyangiaceae bacterium]
MIPPTPTAGNQQIPTGHQAASIMRAEETIFEGQPSLLPSIKSLGLVVITVGLAIIYFLLRRSGTKYRITSQRIVIDSGILSKKLEQVDLYRVNDFVVERPLSQRIMGTGNLTMTTTDKSNPTLRLFGLGTDVVALYERIRAAVEAAKQAKGVRVVDNE